MRYRLTLLLLMTTCIILNAQKYTSTNKKAIKQYESAKACHKKNDKDCCIQKLKKAISADPQFIEAQTMLGLVLAEVGKYEESISELNKAVYLNPEFSHKTLYTLGRMEVGLGKYEAGKKHLEAYLKMGKATEYYRKKAELDIINCEFAIEALKNPVPFNPVNMGPEINTDHYEYFPAITADDQTFLFTRNFRPEKNDPAGHWQEDFYYSEKVNGKWSTAQSIGKQINTSGNEGAPCLSVDGQTLFFVVCQNIEGYGLDRKGYGSCDIFFAQKIGEKWSKAANLGMPVNSNGWETQPSFSSDGKTLYFIKGQVDEEGVKSDDIYYSVLDDNGVWGKPLPLPNYINTPGKEESVFIHPDNQTLYFASNGLVGMGGMDLYMCKRQPNGEWGKPINLGYPINTWNDENSLLVNASGNIAYFASDRKGGFGGLDIYYFELAEKLRPEKLTYMKGKVFDKETKKPLGSKFELIDLETGNVVTTSYSSPVNGEFLVCLPANKNYALNVSRPEYLFFSQNFSLKESPASDPFLMDVPLSKPKTDEIVRLDNVFFETNKYNLKPESKIELNKLVDFLKKNSSLKIELRGHTDDVGDDKSNLTLSDNRAKAVYEYLIQNGIEKERLSYKGYGETMPVASNDTPEGRQLNRRTEFRIIANQ